MAYIRNKITALLTLIAILMVSMGPLWISKAEAHLGIEICTAQGIKVISAETGENLPDSQKHDTLAPCFICHQLQSQQAILPTSFNLAPFTLTTAPILPKWQETDLPRQNVVRNIIHPRAPPMASIR